MVLPGIYNGRHRTYYFAQYQGFRQVLGTTQVLAVPTLEERQGEDTTTFPGDTLFVPVDPRITPALAIYPLPNAPQGPFGARTYASSSKVSTVANQFSARIDQRLYDKARLFARFSLNNVDGPLTNPSQTAIDPSFAARFFDHQRNVGLSYTRTPSAHLTSETVVGYLRTTPSYPAINQTQPALEFADGMYEPINTVAGSFSEFFANLYQARQNFQWIRGSHTFKTGAEARSNRDTYFGTFARNGSYEFAGGVAYSPVTIRSASGLHDIAPGDPLPDALTSLLTAMPYSYSVTEVPAGLPAGNRTGEVAIRRESYNFYFQDTWKVSPRLVLNYGLRYEVNTRMRAEDGRTSGLVYTDSAGRRTNCTAPGAQAGLLLNLKPEYGMDWRGWGPRLGMDWRLGSHTLFRAGGAIVTILPTMSQVDFIMGATPFVVEPTLFAAPGAPVPFANTASQLELPPIYTPDGQQIFGPEQSSTNVPANTPMDVNRLEQDIAAATPDHRIRPIMTYGVAQNFRNGYIGTWSAGLEREFHDLRLHASYTGTAGVNCPASTTPMEHPAPALLSPLTPTLMRPGTSWEDMVPCSWSIAGRTRVIIRCKRAWPRTC